MHWDKNSAHFGGQNGGWRAWLSKTDGFVVIIAYWVLRVSVLNWGWLILYLRRTLMGGEEVGGERGGGGV